jgi:hypothetical protein
MPEDSLEKISPGEIIDTIKGTKGEQETYHPVDKNGKPYTYNQKDETGNYDQKGQSVPKSGSESGRVADVNK